MNIGEMINSVAAKKGCTKAEASGLVELFFGNEGVVTEALVADGAVRLGQLGTLKTKRREARKGRNPQTKEEMLIPAKNTAVFKVNSAFEREVLNK